MDVNAWKNHFDCIYTPHIQAGHYPPDARLALSWSGQWAGQHYVLSDVESVGRKLEVLDSTGKDTYFRISPMINKRYEGRGEATDGYGLPALFADIDTVDGCHKPFKTDQAGLPHPTREQALELAYSFAPPTLVINSGGGLHAYWRLDELLTTPLLAEGKFAGKFDPTSHEFILLERFNAWLIDTAHEMGFGVDKGVSKDRARVLRCAGSHNYKREPAPVTIIEAAPDAAYSLAWVDERLPEHKPRERKRSTLSRPDAIAGSQAIRKTRRNTQWTFARNVPISFLMEELFEMEPCGGDQWIMPDLDDGSTDSRHARVVTSEDGKVEFAVAYDCRLQELWGVDGFDESLTSWDLVMSCTGYNAALASVITNAFPEPDDDLIEALRNVMEQQQQQ